MSVKKCCKKKAALLWKIRLRVKHVAPPVQQVAMSEPYAFEAQLLGDLLKSLPQFSGFSVIPYHYHAVNFAIIFT